MYTTLKVIQGSFGVTKHGGIVSKITDVAHLDDLKAIKKAEAYSESFSEVLRSFCTHDLCTDHHFPNVGTFDAELHASISRHLSSATVDGASDAQGGARAIASRREQCELVLRDVCHELHRLFDELSSKDDVFGKMMEEWLSKQGSFVKQVSFSDRVKKKFIVAQKFVIQKHGSQGWGLRTHLADMSFAPQRYDSKVNPFESWCLTMLASCLVVSDEAQDMSRKLKDRQCSEATFATVSSHNCLVVGLHTDRMVIERRLLHKLEPTMTNVAVRPRLLREYMEETGKLFLDSIILSEEAVDTFTHAVLQQIAFKPVFFGQSSAQALSWAGHGEWAHRRARQPQRAPVNTGCLPQALRASVQTRAGPIRQPGRRLHRDPRRYFERELETG